MPPFLTLQAMSVFNQPVSFDTSRVTGMGEMFKVHSSQPCAQTPVEPFLAHAACAAAAPPSTLPASRPAPPQDAKKFNQPLNFDTSNVRNMDEMFEVHSSLGSLGQDSCRAFPCTLNARLPPLGDLPASYPPPFGSAEIEGV